ncbi:MAG: DUF2262 domain-containing protein [Pirellulaceae bacterium]
MTGPLAGEEFIVSNDEYRLETLDTLIPKEFICDRQIRGASRHQTPQLLHRTMRACLLIIMLLNGCSGEQDMRQFRPPTGKNLQQIDDRSKTKYQSSLSDIVGVVTNEQGGWLQEGYEVHSFELAIWKDHELVQSDALLVLRAVPMNSVFLNEFKSGEIIRLRVLLSVDRERAIVSDILERHVVDRKLSELAKAFEQEGMTAETDEFGVLTRNSGRFACETAWDGRQVKVSFLPEDLAEQLKTGVELLQSGNLSRENALAFAVDSLLESARDWDEEGRSISREEFLNRIEVNAVTIQAEGSFDIWIDDGELFGGHIIQVSGSLSEGLTYCTIAG